MPLVQNYLSKLLGRNVEITGDVDQLVAMGVGVYTAIKNRQADVSDVVMTDVCPFSLGAGIHAANSPETNFKKNYVMIERNSTLPTRVKEKFCTIEDNQKAIVFNIYQGEHYDPRDNIFLGEFKLEVPPDRAGKQSITVTYTYDLNGLLVVEAVCDSTNQKCEVMISGRSNRIKENKLKSMGENLKKLDYLSEEEMQKKTIENMAKRLYENTTGKVRTHIEKLLQIYQTNISDQSLISMRKMNRVLLQNLLQIELLLKKNTFQENIIEEFEQYMQEIIGEELGEDGNDN